MEVADRQVIKDVREGNIDKFEILVDRYSSKIHHFVASRLFDKTEADDIVQNSFIQLYKALDSFDMRKPVYPYLLAIARNELNQYFRKKHVMLPLNEDLRHSSNGENEGVDITEVVSGLKPDNKKALLWFGEGYSYEEIAKRLNKPLNTVRTLIRRARLYVQKNYKRE